MKEKRILNLLGQVNDDYIAEAAPPKSSKSKHHGVKWGIVAACLCLVLAGREAFPAWRSSEMDRAESRHCPSPL